MPSTGSHKFSNKEFEESFWKRVDKTSDPQGCWLWTGYKTKGYGGVKWNRKSSQTHIVAYLLTGHTIPEGYHLSHSEYCIGKKHCCNPSHLTPKTPVDNNLDKHRDGTMKSKLTAEQVLDIRARNEQTNVEISKEYNISTSTVGRIINRKIWKHI